MMAPAKNPYEVLRLPPTASQQDIDAAYMRLKQLLADDTLASYGMMDPAQAHALSQELDQAYGLLGEASQRTAFDRGQHPWAIEAALGREEERGGDEGQERQIIPQALARAPTPLREIGIVVPNVPSTASSMFRPPKRPAALVLPDSEIPSKETSLDGALLKRLREATQATLEQVSEITKINRRYLIALENDDFALLPAGVYVRGFVSEYLRALGLTHHPEADSQALLRSYIERYQAWRQQR